MKEVIPSRKARREISRQAHRACATVRDVLGRNPKLKLRPSTLTPRPS